MYAAPPQRSKEDAMLDSEPTPDLLREFLCV